MRKTQYLSVLLTVVASLLSWRGPEVSAQAASNVGLRHSPKSVVYVANRESNEGYIRTAFPLGSGYVLWLVTGKYLLSNRPPVQGRGLVPGIAEEDAARILEGAVAALEGRGEAGRDSDLEEITPDKGNGAGDGGFSDVR